MSIPINTRIDIKSAIDSPYAGEWGIVKMFDGQDYHVALWGGTDYLIFNRKELTVRRK